MFEEVPPGKFYRQLFKIVKIKVKVTLKQATKVQGWSTVIALLFL